MKRKKLISYLIILCMVLTMIPFSTMEANAAVKESAGIKNRLVQVVKQTNAKLKVENIFSVNGKNCYVKGVSHGCDNCRLYKMLDYFGESNLKSNTGDGYQCNAFARYVFVKTFGSTKNTIDSVCGYGNKQSTYNAFRTGDLFFSNNHAMIFISCDSKGVNVLDCNGAADLKIRFTKYGYSHANLQGRITVWQAPNKTWNNVNNKYKSTSTTDSTISSTASTLGLASYTSGPGSYVLRGTSIYIKGTVRSNYKISNVKISILNSAGKEIQKGSYNPNAYSADLSKADVGYIYFSKLPVGSYTMKISATDSKQTKTLKSVPFKVRNTLLYNYKGPASTIKKGTSVYIKGTLKSYYKISAVSISIFDANGKRLQYGRYFPNAYTADVSKADVGYIYFSKLARGKYNMQIKATTSEGTAVYKSVNFTVQ